MLSKKQYMYTLIVAILAFFITFAVVYFYTKQNAWDIEITEPSKVSEVKPNLEIVQFPSYEVISPSTKIILKWSDLKTHKQIQAQIDTNSLLGLDKEEVQKQFNDYVVEAFSPKEVVLTKKCQGEVDCSNDHKVYVLGVLDRYVCIKEKDTNKRPVKIDYRVDHLSKYMYSRLLNEEIIITNTQKENLLLNAGSLDKILQACDSE